MFEQVSQSNSSWPHQNSCDSAHQSEVSAEISTFSVHVCLYMSNMHAFVVLCTYVLMFVRNDVYARVCDVCECDCVCVCVDVGVWWDGCVSSVCVIACLMVICVSAYLCARLFGRDA